MTASLGAELRRFREAAGLSQRAVATELGVQRPTLSQWETDKHKPSAEHLSRLDELYGAAGDLAGFREPVSRRLSYAEVFETVADSLIAKVVRDDKGRELGWAHNLPDPEPTPLSTAYVLRTLQLLRRLARVDGSAITEQLARRHSEFGWSNRPGWAKPEANAVVLTAMAALGHVRHVDAELARLEESLDAFDRTRPYVLATVLECVLSLRPDSALADQLTRALLDARTPFREEGRLWTMDASADPEIVEPSLAHTARATTVLRQIRTDTHRAEVEDAVGAALAWIVDADGADNGITEILRSDPKNRGADVPVKHFTAAWTLRAMAGADNVPNARREIALDALWDCFTPQLGLWAWRADASLPSWMTHDAVAALQTHLLSMSATPIAAT
ncbi:helix-turn-helix transcriptional regulator [Labedaea rhizosphaerae]|uniref:Transcriptional regulator with XRE-family HTH domain n=1 Tax=Labedaea rhizosphaerae TaxID=598644 RepID=A0A4R6SG38_LABRH|nr:helix-turn-helix transcriptional regulator [Labedaea rhizosphaerae]TDP98175.1 transcriptional regulator with XRE-family HTH domain [Labedaea rhizosphaerae]